MLRLAGADLRVQGSPGALAGGPAIYVMNHQSSLDIPAAFAVLPVDLRFIAKHTLRKVPFLGWYMSWTGMVFVDRSNSTQAVGSLNAAAERVRVASRSSPTPGRGTARATGILPFKKGPFVLAPRPACPSSPSPSRARRCMPAHLRPFRPGVVRMAIGAPIVTADVAWIGDQLVHQTREAVVALHASLARSDPQQASAPVRAASTTG